MTEGSVSGERTLEQVKTEILRRAGRMNPLESVSAEDGQAAAAALISLDRDHWAEVWSAIGLRHESEGDRLFAAGADPQCVADAYMLAYANCRTGRYPVASTSGKQQAHEHALRNFRKAARYFDPHLQVLEMPFEGGALTAYLQIPAGAVAPPVVIHWGGVDGWKEDRQRNSRVLHRHGLATLTMDMPGAGDNPVRYLEHNAERTFSAAIDHLQQRSDVDGARIGVWGGSFGGYWAAKLAHVEAARIRAAVTQGGNVHYGFQRAWLEPALTRTASNYLLGPSSLLDARSWVLGVRTLEEVLALAPTLSLMDQGLLDGPCAPLLAVNGKRDDQAPIEDVYLLLEYGTAKSARVYPDGGHMGRTPGMKDSVIAEFIAGWLHHTLAG